MSRTCLPFTVTSKCPRCGRENQRNLDSQSLLSPVMSGEQDVEFLCYDTDPWCEHEWSAKVRIDFSIEAVEGCTVRRNGMLDSPEASGAS